MAKRHGEGDCEATHRLWDGTAVEALARELPVVVRRLMEIQEHPAERFASDVRTAEGRAKVAMAFLGLTAALRALNVVVLLAVNAGTSGAVRDGTGSSSTLEGLLAVSGILALTQLGLLIVTATVYLRWLHKVTGLTRSLGGEFLRWTPSEACWGFIIPFISIIRPYHVLRDVHDHLAPDLVPEPQPEVQTGDGMGYREVVVKAPPPPIRLPHASIGAWWACFWFGNVIGNIASKVRGTDLEAVTQQNTLNAVSDSIDLVSACLAIVVVRAVNARLQERFRRVRHNSAEVLRAAGVELTPFTA
ncbi:MAG: DUF4328 domain-containing protein [Deltaproteobacteria bacterium]|nr:DUF4328 domain-containing protein [Deltaproteobacteria bacterium]